jgi:hypothetical protein
MDPDDVGNRITVDLNLGGIDIVTITETIKATIHIIIRAILFFEINPNKLDRLKIFS